MLSLETIRILAENTRHAMLNTMENRRFAELDVDDVSDFHNNCVAARELLAIFPCQHLKQALDYVPAYLADTL